MDGLNVTYIGALTAGVLSFLSPCILPIVPPYLCFIGGVSLDDLEGEADEVRAARLRVISAAIAFVLGFGTVFVLLGVGAAMAGNFITENAHILGPIAGGIIVILGLHFLGVFRIGLLYREARFHVQTKPVGLLGAYVVGLAFAFGWTPCVGPILAAILFVAGSDPNPWVGASLLGTYAIGIGVPFILAAFALGAFLRFKNRFRRYMGAVEKAIGGLLVLTGILIMTGGMADVAQWMIETFPTLGQIG
ncbi:cytochrome c biogenesis protein CcdA [Roseospira marina]|uniref:Cytochrome c biogenesis protein CcdA n=1 Tax=Roseospira marina TaxID=140057 RepID=A0A5M6IEG6_9PROT|nr:cytochrome c biogenesis protein CcdA [Roseospira marina]KAA5606653.1 cytochrome c biogenesis protein CcdA [Roseospira marina]MBB4313940.1 cytochrome c-type biogenesis protein [Roseospira marina]MBB5087102.1 cytochrome c-type biogenesis protein [Roseospira marina]